MSIVTLSNNAPVQDVPQMMLLHRRVSQYNTAQRQELQLNGNPLRCMRLQSKCYPKRCCSPDMGLKRFSKWNVRFLMLLAFWSFPRQSSLYRAACSFFQQICNPSFVASSCLVTSVITQALSLCNACARIAHLGKDRGWWGCTCRRCTLEEIEKRQRN